MGIFTPLHLSVDSLEKNQVASSYDTQILYGRYYPYIKEAYTFNAIEWSFNTNNKSDITVMWMNYLNYLKLEVNDSTADYEILSTGRKKDSGVIRIPYDEKWVILLFNLDPEFPSTSISVEINVILDPVMYIIIPLVLNVAIITFFISATIYYKKQSKENKFSFMFIWYVMFLIFYILWSFVIYPYRFVIHN